MTALTQPSEATLSFSAAVSGVLLRALGTSVAVPLSSRRPILQTAASSRSVATQFS